MFAIDCTIFFFQGNISAAASLTRSRELGMSPNAATVNAQCASSALSHGNTVGAAAAAFSLTEKVSCYCFCVHTDIANLNTSQ